MNVRFDVNDSPGRETLRGTSLGEALRALTPDRPPAWGRLTAHHMVEHLLRAFDTSTGLISASCTTSQEWRDRAKAFLHDNRPTPHGFESPGMRDGLPPLRFESVSTAAEALQTAARRFLDLSRSQPFTLHTHPVFGPCSVDEWSRAHFKHCVHHLLQFDLIGAEDGREPGE